MVCLAWLNGKKSIYLKGFSFFCRPSTSCSLLRHENNDRADYDGQLLFSAGLFYFSFFFSSSRFPPSWDSFISFTQESFSSTLISLRFFSFFLSSSIRRGLCKSSGEEVTTVERNQEEGERKNHLFTWPILSRLSRCFTLGIQMFLPAGRKVEFFFFFFLQDLMD